MTWKTISALVLGFGLIATAGCDKPAPATSKPADDDHGHGAGPHGGVILELGNEKFHGEFVVDHDKKEATVYMLGADAKSPMAVKADKLSLSITNSEPKMQFDLLPVEKDKDGKVLKFVGTNDGLAKKMDYIGTVTGVIEGAPRAADFKEEPAKK